MSEYRRSIDLDASADAAFAFVSDVGNLPRYVPTTRSAAPAGEGRVHVEGEAAGHPYANEGRLEIDASARTMRWGSDENDYRGELSISEVGEGASRAEITLRFRANAEPDDEQVERSLDESLERLKAAVRG